jgi:hypothetical protein
LDTLESIFLHWPLLMLASGQPLHDSRPGLWTIDTASGLPVFTFLTGPALQVATVVFPAPENRIGLRALWYWGRRQVQDFWFCEVAGWRCKDAEATLLRHLYRRTIRRFLDTLCRSPLVDHHNIEQTIVRRVLAWQGRVEWAATWYPVDDSCGPALWAYEIEADKHCLQTKWGRPVPRCPYVVHFLTGSLSEAAGTQLVRMAQAQSARGWSVEVVIADESSTAMVQTRALLTQAGIPYRALDGWGPQACASRQIDWDLLRAAPPPIRETAFGLIASLIRHWPDVLHCWLHPATLIGAVAGLMTSVTQIHLHWFDRQPGDFPDLATEPMQTWYATLARSTRVRLAANSQSTAATWASWIGVPVREIQIGPNLLATEDHRLPATPMGAQMPAHRPTA